MLANSTWAEVIPFLITATITVFSVAFGTFLFKIIWYCYGKLELKRIARVTMPVPRSLSIGIAANEGLKEYVEYHHYVKVVVRNDSKKAFEDVKPVITLKG